MVSCKQFVILALSGSTMAFPAVFKRDWKYGQGRWHGGWGSGRTWSDVAYTWETVTETEEAPAATAAPVTTTADAAPVVTVTATYGYTPVVTYSAAPVVTSSAAPVVTSTAVPAVATTASATTASSAPAGSDTSLGGYMSIQTKWRVAGGLKAFIYDSKLEANALKTVKDSNGKMVHELNPGSMGQVLAPGDATNFEHVYVGGWLCEVPTLPGLNGICATQSVGWDHSSGETGHADILTSKSYTKIGCALYAGIWACDVA